MKVISIFVASFLMMSVCFGEETQNVVDAEPINVDGYLKEKEQVQDTELAQIHTEIQRQKKEIVLNKEKVKTFKELGKSVEQLSEATEEYLEEKKAAQAEIAAYNLKVKCLQTENPGSECAKYVRNRR